MKRLLPYWLNVIKKQFDAILVLLSVTARRGVEIMPVAVVWV